jgi:pimeloyl-ACP methyl ester carboxylesterase
LNSKRKLASPKGIVRLVVIVLLTVLIGLYIGLPVGMGVAVVIPGKESVGPPPQGFEVVTLSAADGVELAGWYTPPENGAAIILLHGAGSSRAALRPYAEMLARYGYGVLALDLRGHGESSGKTNRLGWQSTPDVGAAIAYLQARPGVERIGGLGLSLGGEVLLGAAGEYPALRAIVADGATRRSVEELLALPSERSLYRNFTARVMYATVGALSGERPPEPLLDSMLAAQSTAYLLIAGGANQLEVDFNELFAGTVGERARLWVAPGAGHTGAFARYGDEYEQRVIAFFEETLLDSRVAVRR